MFSREQKPTDVTDTSSIDVSSSPAMVAVLTPAFQDGWLQWVTRPQIILPRVPMHELNA